MSERYFLIHYGIKDQKWGVRRFQNPDGTLTAAGKKRYRGSQPGYSNLGPRPVSSLGMPSKRDSESRDAIDPPKHEKDNDESVSKPSFDVSNMSDSELSRTIERMRLEKNYNELVTEKRNNESIGKKVGKAIGIIATVATVSQNIYNVANNSRNLKNIIFKKKGDKKEDTKNK